MTSARLHCILYILPIALQMRDLSYCQITHVCCYHTFHCRLIECCYRHLSLLFSSVCLRILNARPCLISKNCRYLPGKSSNTTFLLFLHFSTSTTLAVFDFNRKESQVVEIVINVMHPEGIVMHCPSSCMVFDLSVLRT